MIDIIMTGIVAGSTMMVINIIYRTKKATQETKADIMHKIFMALMRVRLSDQQKAEFITELQSLGVLPREGK